MAVTVASITSAALAPRSPNPVVTGAFTPSNGVLLMALFWAIDGTTNCLTTPTISDSLGGTWTNRISTGLTGSGLHIWTRPVVTGASMTVSCDITAGDCEAKQVQILAFSGANNTTPIGASVTDTTLGNTTGAMTLSAAPASTSAVIAARIMEIDDTETASATPGSGWTEHFDQTTTDRGGLETQSRISSTSTSVVWVSVNAAAATNFSCCGAAIEIVAAASSSRMSQSVNFF